MKRRVKLLKLASLIVLVGVGGGMFAGLASRGASALSYRRHQRLGFTFNPVIELTLSSTDLSIANLGAGLSDVSNAISIGVATNTLGGFVLNATVGSSANTTENVTGLNNGNYKFTSVATDADLVSLTADNTWGYSTSSNNGSTWSNYNGLPAYTTSSPAVLLDVTPDPYAQPSSGSIQFRIGAKAGNSQASGEYSNQINFTAVTKPLVTTYSITYHDNSGAATGMPSDVGSTNIIQDIDVQLSTTEPTRAGYEFAGWCTVSTSDGSCSGNVYQAGDYYSITNNGDMVSINLYAMWVTNLIDFDTAFANAGMQQNVGYYIMQDMSSSICSAITVGQESQLMDSRDNKVYYVAKLADDNCWMTQNLDLDIVYGGKMDSIDTDVPNDWADAGKLTDTYGEKDTTWYDYLDAPESYDPGDVCWLGEVGYGYGDTCEDTHYHLGNYYNWTAAVAMSDSSSYNQNGVNVNQSICPAGWRLPLGGSETGSKSFYNLIFQYGWDNGSDMMEGNYTMWDDPLYFPLSGYWRGDLNDIGYYGYYWSSAVSGSDGAYGFNFNGGGGVGLDGNDLRGVGHPVRCVAR